MFLSKRDVAKARRTFQLQEESKDCGSSCLLSVLRFYGGDSTVSQINELTGTNITGTTLLGLHQACKELGLESEALRAKGIFNLCETSPPSILHVLINKSYYHYIIYYGRTVKGAHLIGDPATGICIISDSELEQMWQSKILLSIKPDANRIIKDVRNERRIKIFFSILRDENKFLLISCFVGLMIAMFSLSSALFYQNLVDKILLSNDGERLLLGIASLTALLISNLLLTYVRNLIIHKQSRILNNRIFSKFFENLIFLSKSFFDKKKIGDIISRLVDVRNIDIFITQAIGNGMVNLLIVVIFISVMFAMSFKIALITLSTVPLTLYITKQFIDNIIPLQRRVLTSYGETESVFYEIVKGIDTIKSFSKEKFFLETILPLFDKFQTSSHLLNKIESKFSFLIGLVMIFNIMAIVLLCSIEVLHERMKVGQMFSVIFLSTTVVNAVNDFIPLIMIFEKVNVSLDRLNAHFVLKAESPLIHEENRESIERIDINNLSFEFPGSSKILKQASFSVNRGELIMITGDIGSGKSLFLSLLLKLYDNVHGSVSVTSKDQTLDWTEMPVHNWRNLFAIVPQEIVLFNGSILQNIALESIENQQTLERAMGIYFSILDSQFEKMPEGPFTLIGQGGIQVSGGQAKLIGLARAIFKNSRILLLDELTAGMDDKTESFTAGFLNELKKSSIILFVNHEAIRNLSCDKKYVLDNGEFKLIDNAFAN